MLHAAELGPLQVVIRPFRPVIKPWKIDWVACLLVDVRER